MADAVKLSPVASSSIAAVGHDPERDELHVEFKNGGRYAYPGVSADQHKALISADSVGGHFQSRIRPKFKGKKL